MTAWAASITADEAGLRLRFDRPVQLVEMSHEKARELAAVLLVAAEGLEAGKGVAFSDILRSVPP